MPKQDTALPIDRGHFFIIKHEPMQYMKYVQMHYISKIHCIDLYIKKDVWNYTFFYFRDVFTAFKQMK